MDLAQARRETVFVSAAAGPVGSVAGQLARIKGCRVVGSAGSAAKVAFLLGDLGFDAAFNYKDRDVENALPEAAPDGIDVYFDNAGGQHLSAALNAIRPGGRISLCAMVSQYNAASPPPGPDNLGLAITKRLTLRGFTVADHLHRFPPFLDEVGGYLAHGQLVAEETVFEGIEQAPQAFLAMLRGDTIGKTVVRLPAMTICRAATTARWRYPGHGPPHSGGPASPRSAPGAPR